MIRTVDRVLRRKWNFYAMSMLLYKTTKFFRCHRLKYNSQENRLQYHKHKRFLHYSLNYILMAINAAGLLQWIYNLIYAFYVSKNRKVSYEAQNYFLIGVIAYVFTLSFAVMSMVCVWNQKLFKIIVNELLTLTQAIRVDMRCELQMPPNFWLFIKMHYLLSTLTVVLAIISVIKGTTVPSVLTFTYVVLYEIFYGAFVLIQIAFVICYENLILFQSRNLLNNDERQTKWTIRHQTKLANLQLKLRKLNSTFLLLVYLRTFVASANLYQGVTCGIFARNLSSFNRLNAFMQELPFPLLQFLDVFIICSLGSELSKKFEQFKIQIFVSLKRLKQIFIEKHKDFNYKFEVYQLHLAFNSPANLNAFHIFQFERGNLLNYLATLACITITYVQYYVSEAGFVIHEKKMAANGAEMYAYDLFYNCYKD